MIRVLVVDDDPAARRSLRLTVTADPTIVAAAEAPSGPAAIEAARRVELDVVLMDAWMPDGDGISATRTLAAPPYNLPVLVLVRFDNDASIFGAVAAGAVGVLLKSSSKVDVARAIHAAARGDGFVSPEVTPRLLAAAARADRDAAAAGTVGLTRREVETIKVLCSGPSTNRGIAERLNVEPATVKGYLKSVMAKLDLHSRAGLVTWAFRNGIVQ